MQLFEFNVEVDKEYTARVSMRAVSHFERHWKESRGVTLPFLKTLVEGWSADDVVKFIRCCLGDQVKHLNDDAIASALPFEFSDELQMQIAVHAGKKADTLKNRLGIQGI